MDIKTSLLGDFSGNRKLWEAWRFSADTGVWGFSWGKITIFQCKACFYFIFIIYLPPITCCLWDEISISKSHFHLRTSLLISCLNKKTTSTFLFRITSRQRERRKKYFITRKAFCSYDPVRRQKEIRNYKSNKPAMEVQKTPPPLNHQPQIRSQTQIPVSYVNLLLKDNQIPL